MDKRLIRFEKALNSNFPQLTASLLSKRETDIVKKQRRESMSFWPNEYNEKEKIERIRDLIVPSDIKKCRMGWNYYGNGWISPDGLFYECRPEGHREYAQYLSEVGIIPNENDEQQWLDNHNWMRLSDGVFLVGGYSLETGYIPLFPTQSQIDCIFDYFTKFRKIKFNGREFFSIQDFLDWVEEDKESMR